MTDTPGQSGDRGRAGFAADPPDVSPRPDVSTRPEVSTRSNVSDRPDVSDVSVGQLVGEVLGNVSTLVRQEIELAKAEVGQEAKKSGRGVGMLGGAGVAGHFVLLFLSLALMWGLGTLIGNGWASLVVALLWAIVGAVLYSRGRQQLRQVKKPEQTLETIKEDVQWAKNQKR